MQVVREMGNHATFLSSGAIRRIILAIRLQNPPQIEYSSHVSNLSHNNWDLPGIGGILRFVYILCSASLYQLPIEELKQ